MQREIPASLISAYTMGGAIPVLDLWRDDSVSAPVLWDVAMIKRCQAMYSDPLVKGEPYTGATHMFHMALSQYRVRGKRVAVIGSRTPWIEAILLNFGCRDITTVEYNVPKCLHASIRTISFGEFCRQRTFYDMIISYSSIEHSGLGRYGDFLVPDADLHTMAIIRRALVPNGIVMLGVPVGPDALVWNAHRIYGNLRLPLLLNGFKELEWYGFEKEDLLSVKPAKMFGEQPLIILSPAN